MPKNKNIINNLTLIGAGALIGHQAKKTLQNNDKNKTKIGISSTCAITGMTLNAVFNPHATMMNTLQAGAGGMLIGKGGKFIVDKGTTYIKNTPQYQVLKHGHNIQKKIKKTKDFGSIKKVANALHSQKKYVKRQNKSNAL